jgi:hypothetical protein
MKIQVIFPFISQIMVRRSDADSGPFRTELRWISFCL